MKPLPPLEALAICSASAVNVAASLRETQAALHDGRIAVAVYHVGRAVGANGLVRTHLDQTLTLLSSSPDIAQEEAPAHAARS